MQAYTNINYKILDNKNLYVYDGQALLQLPIFEGFRMGVSENEIKSIEALNNIAIALGDKNFESSEQEREFLEVLEIQYPFLAALHCARVAYLYALNQNWIECLNHFYEAINFLEKGSLEDLSHTEIIFYAQTFFAQGIINLAHLNDYSAFEGNMNDAKEYMMKVPQSERDMDDHAIILSYYLGLISLIIQLKLVETPVQTERCEIPNKKLEDGTLKCTKKLEKIVHSIENYINRNELFEDVKNFSCNNNVSYQDEANKAAKMFADASVKILPEENSSLIKNSIFNQSSKNTDHPKSTITYNFL